MALPALKPTTNESDALQFDRAELGERLMSRCTSCEGALAGSYWAVNGQPMCGPCREKLVTSLTERSGRMGRVVRAVVFGGLGGLTGAAVYMGIAAVTGYEFGLIAILVGWLVGNGVRMGSGGRGGWAYQSLAIGLTYIAIVSAYVPSILTYAQEQVAAERTASEAGQGSGENAEVAAAKDDSTAPIEAGSPLGLIVGAGFLLAVACALPFLGGVQNIMGLIIIAIGLQQAWALNKRPQLDVSGPHDLAPLNG